MPDDSRPWDSLSRASADYTYTLFCDNMQPRCGHSAMLNVGAAKDLFGDRTLQWVRERARCTVCGHLGATVIVTPIWTGPADLAPHPIT